MKATTYSITTIGAFSVDSIHTGDAQNDNEKTFVDSSSSSTTNVDSDEEEAKPNNITLPSPSQFRVRNIILTAALTALLILSIITLTSLYTDSHSGAVPHAPSPPPRGGTKVIAHCGTTVQEALDLGCKWDIMSFGWLHPACFDAAEATSWEEKWGPWEWYRAINQTHHEPRRLELEELPYEPFIVTTHGYHLMHCLYVLKMAHLGVLDGRSVSNEAVDLGHTEHCIGAVGESSNVDYGVLDTPVKVLFAQCLSLD